MLEYNMRKLSFSNVFLIGLGGLNILPFLAPILMAIGATPLAKVIYFIYSFFCHQISWRSLQVGDHQCAWCSRCMAMWGGTFLMALVIKIFGLKGLKWYQILPFMIPIALDGGIQTIASVLSINNNDPVYISTNLMRWITGGFFGIGLGATMMPIILESEAATKLGKTAQAIKAKFKLNTSKGILIVIATLAVLYLTIVGAWNLSSQTYKPSNFLDSGIKLPADKGFELERRGRGICPVRIDSDTVRITDALALDCFLERN